jgi:hypothetical protein
MVQSPRLRHDRQGINMIRSYLTILAIITYRCMCGLVHASELHFSFPGVEIQGKSQGTLFKPNDRSVIASKETGDVSVVIKVEANEISLVLDDTRPDLWPRCALGRPTHITVSLPREWSAACSFKKIGGDRYEATLITRLGSFTKPHDTHSMFSEYKTKVVFRFDGTNCEPLSFEKDVVMTFLGGVKTVVGRAGSGTCRVQP